MSDEARIQNSLQIRKQSVTDPTLTTIDYQSRPSAFTVDVSGSAGPSPGALQVPVTGRDVYFTELVTPGLCRIFNMDDTNYVQVGTRDPQTNAFYPFLEIGPGESYVIKLSRYLQQQYTGSGSGGASGGNYMRIKASVATCVVLVEAFEK